MPCAVQATMNGGLFSNWRLELFHKSHQELQSLVPMYRRHGISKFNLTNKRDDDDLLSDVRVLKEMVPGVDICAHYSIKNNYHRSTEVAMGKFLTFEKVCARLACFFEQ